MDKNLKHTVTRFLYNLLHLTLMFCAAWLLMFIPYLMIENLWNITFDYKIRLTINILPVIILYVFVYKNNTLKVHTAWLTFIVLISSISVFLYNFTIFTIIFHFTENYELSDHANLISYIFTPIPILFYFIFLPLKAKSGLSS